MNNESLNITINELSQNLGLLLNELNRLRDENAELKKSLQIKEEELKDFHNKSKISKLVESIAPDGTDAEKLKTRIEENIQIIDKCIAQLSRNETELNIK